jgi:hypothetical protein
MNIENTLLSLVCIVSLVTCAAQIPDAINHEQQIQRKLAQKSQPMHRVGLHEYSDFTKRNDGTHVNLARGQ